MARIRNALGTFAFLVHPCVRPPLSVLAGDRSLHVRLFLDLQVPYIYRRPGEEGHPIAAAGGAAAAHHPIAAPLLKGVGAHGGSVLN